MLMTQCGGLFSTLRPTPKVPCGATNLEADAKGAVWCKEECMLRGESCKDPVASGKRGTSPVSGCLLCRMGDTLLRTIAFCVAWSTTGAIAGGRDGTGDESVEESAARASGGGGKPLWLS